VVDDPCSKDHLFEEIDTHLGSKNSHKLIGDEKDEKEDGDSQKG